MRYTVLLILLACTFEFHCQTSITLNAPKHHEKEVKLSKVINFSTFRLEPIEKSWIDSNGLCHLKIVAKEAFLSVVEIDNEYGLLYIDPKTENYDLLFLNEQENLNRLRKQAIQLTFNNLPKNDLNTLILDFNLRLDYFLYGDTTSIIRMAKRNQEFTDSLAVFKEQLIPLYGSIKKRYLHNYIRYSIASIEQLANYKNLEKNRLINYNFYLKDMPVLYSNNAYMAFFNQFYEKVLSLPETSNEDKIKFAINNYNSFEKLDLVLAEDYYLKDKRIRELAIINGLAEIYYNKYFNPNNILSIIKEIELKSQYDEHKKICHYLLQTLTRLNKGTKAPEILLENQFREEISLSKQNKPTYITFFSSKNPKSIMDMEIIKSLYSKYKKSISFISISIDEKKSDYLNFTKNYSDYKWSICHYEFNYQLIEDYQLKNLPTYILIDKDGKIDQAPAYSPVPDGNNNSIDKTFFYISKSGEYKGNFNVGKKDVFIGDKQ